MRLIKCNMCYEDITKYNEAQLSVRKTIGYGSEYDGTNLNLDICSKCFDKMMREYILPNCEISPLEGKDNY